MKRILFAAAATVAFVSATAASAVTFTYAQYFQSAGDGPSLNYVNCEGSSNAACLADTAIKGVLSNNGSTTVRFKFFDDPSDNVTLPSVLTTEGAANLTLGATTTTSALIIGTSANAPVWQTFDSGFLKFTGTGALAGKNLLTINFTGMDLSTRLNAGGASSFVSTPDSTLLLTSDFFDFGAITSANFSLSLSAVLPSVTVGSNGAIGSFIADSSGTFASDPAPLYVPEPGMLGLFGAGALGLGLARRRKK